MELLSQATEPEKLAEQLRTSLLNSVGSVVNQHFGAGLSVCAIIETLISVGMQVSVHVEGDVEAGLAHFKQHQKELAKVYRARHEITGRKGARLH